MDITKTLVSLFGLLVFFGVLAMVLGNPSGANVLMASTANTISSTTRTLEGR